MMFSGINPSSVNNIIKSMMLLLLSTSPSPPRREEKLFRAHAPLLWKNKPHPMKNMK